jgi:hypothetical protein
MEYGTVSVSEVDLSEAAPLRFRWRLPGEEGCSASDDSLVDSVGELGVFAPPIIADLKTGLEVVSGFRRLAAAREAGIKDTSALVILPLDAGIIAALPVWLESSLHGEPLSDMERISVAARIAAIAGDRISEFIPLVSRLFGRSMPAELAGRLIRFSDLDAEIQEGIHSGRLSPGDLLRLEEHPGIDLDIAASLLARSGLSRSARREAVRGLLRIADMGNGAFEQFARRYDPGKLTLDKAIRRSINPTMAGDEERISGIIEGMRLPPGTTVHLPENLEGNSLTVEIKAVEENSLRLSLDRLHESFENGSIEEIMGILRGRGR